MKHRLIDVKLFSASIACSCQAVDILIPLGTTDDFLTHHCDIIHIIHDVYMLTERLMMALHTWRHLG